MQRAPEIGTIVVTGADRKSWLNGMVTCDLAPLGAGQGAYGLSVIKTGKILSDLRIVLAADRIFAGAPRDRIPVLIDHLEKYLIMEDAEIRDASGEFSWILIHGPGARDLIDRARGEGADAATVDMTGLGGAAVVVPAPSGDSAALDRIESLLVAQAAGRAAVCTPDGWQQLRVEIGLPLWHTDYDDQNYPQEASLEQLAVSFQKGCYLGQETVFMLQMRGHVKKKLARILVQGEPDVPPGTEIALCDHTPVGSITSRAPSPDGSGVVALGYVKYKHAVPGTELSIQGRSARVL